MLFVSYFAVLFILAVLSLTKKRIFIICGFYCFYALLTILDEGSVPHLGPVTVYRALYIIITISLVVRLIRDPGLSQQVRRWPLFPYGFLVVLLFASSLYSQASQPFSGDPGSLWGRFVVISLFWMAAFHVQSESDLKVFAGTTVAVSLVLSFWVIWSAAHLNFEAFRGGIEADQNYVSGFVMVGALPILNGFFTGGRRSYRLLCLLVLFCVLFTCVLLASLGMFAAFAIAAVAIAIKSLRHRRRTLIAAGAALLMTLGIVLLLPGSQSLLGRFSDADLRSLDQRTFVWSYSLRYFGDSSLPRMIFGQGLASDPPILKPVLPGLENYHNDYLRWLMDRGIVGLTVWLIFLYSVWGRIAHGRREQTPLMIGWFVFLLVASLSEAASDWHLFWIMLGIISASSILGNNRPVYAAAAKTRGVINPEISGALGTAGAP